MTGDIRHQTSPKIVIPVCAEEQGQTPFVKFKRFGGMEVPLPTVSLEVMLNPMEVGKVITIQTNM